jgi:hypothetical protein
VRSKGQEAWLPASRPANKGGRSTKGASMSGEALVVWRASSAFGCGINLPDGILERSTGSVACLTTLVDRQILAQQKNADLVRESDTRLTSAQTILRVGIGNLDDGQCRRSKRVSDHQTLAAPAVKSALSEI